MPTLSIVIPAYNERPTLVPILCRVLAVDLSSLGLEKEIVVVDDGSTDGTRQIVEDLARDWRAVMEPALDELGADARMVLREARLVCILLPENRGKGTALRKGIAATTGDFVLVQDADLEYDPADYPRIVAPLVEGRADAVYGSRFLSGERRAPHLWHTAGNRLLTALSNLVNGLDLTDMETCYKAFRADVIKTLKLESPRFGFEPEVTAKLARMRYRICEVPVGYRARGYESGKKITWKDGVAAIWCILKYRFSRNIVQ